MSLHRRTLLGAALLAPAIRPAHAQARVLRYVPQADLAILDPLMTTALVTRDHAHLVFDMLYAVDEHNVPHPQMVAGHVVEQDGLLWRLTLRDGLHFHDGEPVLARDVVASINRWLRRDFFGFDLLPRVEEISAAGDQDVHFRLKQPFPLLPFVLGKSSSHMPAIMPARLAATEATRAVPEMIGSGPFRFLAGERVSGSRNVYERFAGYVPRANGTTSFLAGPKVAHLDRVEWVTIPDAATAAGALQSGEVDWWSQPIPDLLPTLQRNPALRTEVLDPAGYLAALRFNQLHPPFDNPAVRRALLPAVNQADAMTAAAGTDHRFWRDGIGYMTPGPMANDVGMAALTGPRDLAAARAALRASGYNGERVVVVGPTDYASINAITQVSADVLRQVGFNVDYQAVDWGTQVQRWNSQQPLDKGGWSAVCITTSALTAMDPAENRLLRGIGRRGNYGWPESARMEALRDAFMAAGTEASRRDICARMQAAAFEEVPYIPLGVFFQPTSWRRNVTGQLKGFPVFWNLRKE
jgi:peptide/nickel transport system substrate-binding protein